MKGTGEMGGEGGGGYNSPTYTLIRHRARKLNLFLSGYILLSLLCIRDRALTYILNSVGIFRDKRSTMAKTHHVVFVGPNSLWAA